VNLKTYQGCLTSACGPVVSALVWLCCVERRRGDVLRVQIKPDPDEAASMPDPTERAVQRRVDFDLGNDSGLHPDERQRLAIGELARPSGRQWTWPRMPGTGSAEWQAAH
jgi:hypothetical protein